MCFYESLLFSNLDYDVIPELTGIYVIILLWRHASAFLNLDFVGGLLCSNDINMILAECTCTCFRLHTREYWQHSED